MPHIHTESGQIDCCVNVYVVYKNKVLLRFHEKYRMWITPGGHVELDEVPEDAAVREVKEEVGLDVSIWSGNKEEVENPYPREPGRYRELIPPMNMNIHDISPEHRHMTLAYFALAASDAIIEPDTDEKSGGCRWLTREELIADREVDVATKHYALKALDLLSE